MTLSKLWFPFGFLLSGKRSPNGEAPMLMGLENQKPLKPILMHEATWIGCRGSSREAHLLSDQKGL